MRQIVATRPQEGAGNLRAMKVRLFLVGGAAGALALGLGLFGGCGDSSGTGGGGAGGEDPLADVIYEAEATDEALDALLAATPKDEPAKAAVIDAPTDAEVVAAAAPIAFTWHDGATARIEIRPSNDSVLERLGMRLLERALSNVRPAYAHGVPVNGPAYFLVLSTADDPELVRVFTLATSYTPDATVWQKIVGAGKPITATVESAQFEENRVLQDGGPWVSEPVSFTVE